MQITIDYINPVYTPAGVLMYGHTRKVSLSGITTFGLTYPLLEKTTTLKQERMAVFGVFLLQEVLVSGWDLIAESE